MMRRRRRALGLSLSDFAELTGLTRNGIWKIENKKVKPRQRTIDIIQRALDEAEQQQFNLASIRQRRRKLKVRIAELADKTDLGKSTIIHVEQLDHKFRPRPETVKKILVALDELEAETATRYDFRKERLDRGLPQRLVAQRARVGQDTISSLENYQRKTTSDTMKKVKAVLDAAEKMPTGPEVKQRRIALGFTQKELARKARVCRRSLGMFEDQKLRFLMFANLKKLAGALRKWEEEAEQAVKPSVVLSSWQDIKPTRTRMGIGRTELADMIGIHYGSLWANELVGMSRTPKPFARLSVF